MIRILVLLLLAGCAGAGQFAPDFQYVPVSAGDYEIATWRRITDPVAPVHIYIEGDGNSFNSRGRPTCDPTPHGRTVRDMVARDTSPNVVYIARPCQYVMTGACNAHDWTDGRFSSRVIDAMTDVVRDVAGARPVALVGYSGGALVSGLIVTRAPDINVEKWITVAGVLNHADWTAHFGDSPLYTSLNLDKLPNVPQAHYIAEHDRVVPEQLSRKWTGGAVQTVPGATHTNMRNLQINFDK